MGAEGTGARLCRFARQRTSVPCYFISSNSCCTVLSSKKQGDRSLICSPKMRNKERGLHPCRPRSRYLRQRGRRGFEFCRKGTTQYVISTVFFSPVISTERSEWRDLINAPFGASGKPQRYLDYARYEAPKPLLTLNLIL